VSQRDFDATAVLARLKGFQRDTVEHVTRRFYGPEPVRRFLVADETGLGKSLVARGVIARSIEHLQHDDSVGRIDIVYVCSNADLAQQNISRLDVTGDPHLSVASRLTLLAKHSSQFSLGRAKFTKPVNLVSFTPGTSFDMGWQTGKAEERAMLFLLLEPLLDLSGYRRRATVNLLRGQVSHHDRFAAVIGQLRRELDGEIDAEVAEGFEAAMRSSGMLTEFSGLIDEMGRRQSVPGVLRDRVRRLTGTMRSELARVSVRTLEPDLIILDEFQRFRHLLDDSCEAGQLAHHLFDYGQAKVLLLSATPYKPFTYAEESEDDHHRDFLQTLRFLANGAGHVDANQVAASLSVFRRAAVTGQPVADVVGHVRDQLLRVMCRTERPRVQGADMLAERCDTAEPLEAGDLVDYVGLRRLARAVKGQVSVEYWKSAPYFVNFCDGYQLAEHLRRDLRDPRKRTDLLPLVRVTQRLNPDAVRAYTRIDYGNARLRRLAADTVDAGWWKLLWIPPSLPYLVPAGPYAEPFASGVTKRLIFSSWTATPTAVASLLSYEAERRIAEGTRLTENSAEARRSIAGRLTYRLDSSGRPQAMTTLALFWPMPGLAARADPLQHARREGAPAEISAAEELLAGQLARQLPAGETSRATASDAWYWAAAFRTAGALPGRLVPADPAARDAVLGGLSGETGPAEADADDPAGLTAHVEAALRVIADDTDLPSPPPDLGITVARIGMHSPGNIAWRALGRLIYGQNEVTPSGHWHAAAVLAGGLRAMFRRIETTLLLDRLCQDQAYWRSVLQYSAWGNLQAVLDEYLHHLAVAEGVTSFDDCRLAEFAETAARAIGLRPSRYEAFDPLAPDQPIAFTSRFALRYGGRRQNEETSRQPEIRGAFNSPFWPFVLATTSVGQEGIDFHWWSHALLHWNTPANPVDFEQREGRVDRYAGHAVRRNIAGRHSKEILAAGGPNPWHAAYGIAVDERGTYGEFAPEWVYPGPARIERHVAPYPLSVDLTRLARVKEDLALYRLTFGQPRQEDMLELLRHRGVARQPSLLRELGLNLAPPGSGSTDGGP
jgi:hypothetical protein